jgi:hypothetical protein
MSEFYVFNTSSNYVCIQDPPYDKGCLSGLDLAGNIIPNCDFNNNGLKIIRPWSRFDGECQTNTQSTEDLNMRRKAEVLQYKKNSSNLTKSQKYSLAARNLLTKKKSWASQKRENIENPTDGPILYHNLKADRFILSCSNTAPIRKYHTSQSDVPGKSIELKYDKSVPLTMYTPVRRTYKGGTGKWPRISWYPGAMGFPVGKKG